MALYDAFISYSHAKDKPIAAALQRVVQRLGKAWYQRRALRIFRDDTSLSATPHLWPSIEQALNQSRFFILLASPEAAASKWVNKEVTHWLERNSPDTLLIGVTDGELAWDETTGDFRPRADTPLPPALQRRFATEPKWVDLHAYRDGADPRDSKFTELGADFAAAIRGMPKEDLLSQELRQQRRALRLAWSAAGLLLALTAAAGWQTKVATEQRGIAETNEQRAIAQQQEADRQRDLAVKNERLAVANEEKARRERDQALLTQSRFLADLAQQQIAAGDATGGMLLALEALPDLTSRDELRRSRPYSVEAERALFAGHAARREQIVLKEHTGSVNRAFFTANGRRVLTTSWDGTARLWDADTGRRIKVFKGHTAGLAGAAFSPDERRIVTWSQDRTARLWDADKATTIAVLEGHGSAPVFAAFTPDGQRIVTAGGTTVRVWDVTGKELLVLSGHQAGEIANFGKDQPHSSTLEQAKSESARASIQDAALSRDGSVLITVAKDKTARAWDLVAGKEITVFTKHAALVTRAAISPDGRQAASTSFLPGTSARGPRSTEYDVRIWDVATGKELALIKVADFASSLNFSADGRSILITHGHNIELWDVGTAQQTLVLSGHTGDVMRASFTSNGTQVISNAFDGTARLWDLATGRQLAVFGRHHRDIVYYAALSPDGTRVVTAGGEGTARIWSLHPLPATGWLVTHDGTTSPAAFSADSRFVAAGSERGSVGVWSTDTGKLVAVMKDLGGSVMKAVFSPDGRQLLTSTATGTVRLWDAKSGRGLATVLQQGQPAVAIFSPDGKQILVRFDNVVSILDASNGSPIRRLARHQGFVTDAYYSADGRRILTTSRDRTVRIWDAATGREQHVLTGHTGDVWYAAFADGGKKIVSVAADNSVRVWDSTTGRLVKEIVRLLEGTDQRVPAAFVLSQTLGISPDGRYLAIPYPLDTIIWDLATLEQVKVLDPSPGGVNSPIFSPDGKRLVSFTTQGGGLIRFWDWQEGQIVGSAPSPHQVTMWATLSPDGKTLATGGFSPAPSIRLWRVFPTTQSLVDQARESVPRCLLNEQREQVFLESGLPAWCFQRAIWPLGRTRLGIIMDPVDPADVSRLKLPNPVDVLISTVQDESPAAAAGLKVDDVIVAVNGRPATTTKVVAALIAQATPGDRMTFSIVRDGRAMEIVITIVDLEAWMLDLEHTRAKALLAPRAAPTTAAENNEAIEAADRARQILENLLLSEADNAEWQQELGLAHERLGDALRAQGKRDEALTHYQKSLELRRRLATLDPANAQWQSDRARIAAKTGDVLRDLGRLQEALSRYRESLAIREKFTDPSDAGGQQEIAALLNEIGDLLMWEGKYADAIESHRRALTIRERIAAANPDHQQKWDISASHEGIGDVLAAEKKHEAALDAYRKSAAIRDQLVGLEPDNAVWQRDLATTYRKIGQVLVAAGRRDEALEAHSRSLAIREKLTSAQSVQSFVDLLIGYDDVAKLLFASGRNEEALGLYRKSLDIVHRLAAAFPRNLVFQHVLATGHENVARALMRLDGAKDALEAAKSGLKIRRELAADDPKNAERQSRLRVSLTQVGNLLLSLEAPADALPYFDEAIALAPNRPVGHWNRARANLYADLPDAAARDMATAVKLRPSFAFYAIWLYIARTRAGQSDPAELAAHTQQLDHARWPWPIIALYLGTSTTDAVRTAARSAPNETARAIISCQGNFYAGVYQVEKGAPQEARPLLQSALQTCGRDNVEWTAAKLELKRLDRLATSVEK